MVSFAAKLVLLAWVVASPLRAEVREACPKFLTAVASSSARLKYFVGKFRALKRRYSGDPFFQDTVSRIRNAEDGEANIIQDEQLTMSLRFRQQNGQLTLTISHLCQRGIRWNSRPKPEETEFPRAFAAILVGLGDRARLQPEIRRIDVVAEMVQNPELPALLKQLGFRDRWSMRSTVRALGTATFGLLSLLAIPALSSLQPSADAVTMGALWIAPLAMWFLPAERRLALRLDLPAR